MIIVQYLCLILLGQGKRPHDDSSEGGSAKKPRGRMVGWEKIEIRLLIPYNVSVYVRF